MNYCNSARYTWGKHTQYWGYLMGIYLYIQLIWYGVCLKMGYTPKLSSFNRTINHLISRYFIFIQTHTHTHIYIYTYVYIYIHMIIDNYVHGYHMTWDIRLHFSSWFTCCHRFCSSSGRIEQLSERLKLTVTSSSRGFWMGNGDILGGGGYKYIHRYIHTHIRIYIYNINIYIVCNIE